MATEKYIKRLYKQGNFYLSERRYHKAREIFSHINDLNPDETDSLRLQAECLTREGRFEKADLVLDQALVLNADDIAVLIEKGKLYLSQDLVKRADAIFDQVFSSAKPTEQDLLDIIIALRDARQLYLTKKYLDIARDIYPQSLDLQAERGILFLARYMNQEATDVFDQLFHNKKLSVELVVRIVEQLWLFGRYDEEQDRLDAVNEIYPDNVYVLLEQAKLYRATGLVEEEENVQQLLVGHKNLTETAASGFIEYASLDPHDEDKKNVIEEMAGRFPESVLMLSKVFLLYFHNDCYADAEQIYDRLLKIRPVEDAVLSNLLKNMVDRNPLFVQSLLDKSKALISDDAALLSIQADIQLVQNQYDMAYDLYLQLVNHPDANQQLVAEAISRFQPGIKQEQTAQFTSIALARFPNSNQIHWQYLSYLARTDRYGELFAALDAALSKGLFDEYTVNRAVTIMPGYIYDDREKRIYDTIAKFYPDHEEVLTYSARRFIRYQQYSKATAEVHKLLGQEMVSVFNISGLVSELNVAANTFAGELIDKALQAFPASELILAEKAKYCIGNGAYQELENSYSVMLSLKYPLISCFTDVVTTLRYAGKQDLAGDYLDRALEKFPRENLLLIEKCYLYLDEKQYSRLRFAFTELLQMKPLRDYEAVNIIDSLIDQNQKQLAGSLLLEAMNTYPDNSQFVYKKARLDAEQNQLVAVEEDFARLQEILEGSDYRLTEIISLLKEKDDYLHAEALINRMLKKEPGNQMALYNLGLLYAESRQYDKAKQVVEKLLALEDVDQYYLANLAFQFRLKRRFTEASEVLEKSLVVYPDSIQLLNEKAALLYDQQRYEEAITCIDKIIEKQGDSDFAAALKISALRFLNKIEQAEELIRQLPEHVAANYKTVNEIGLLYMDKGEFSKARECFEKATQLASYWTEPKLNMVKLLKKENKTTEALKLLQDISKEYQDNAGIIAQLGWLYLEASDLVNAESMFKKLLAKDENSIEGILGMGGVYFSQGLYEEAERQFRKVLDIDSQDAINYTNLAWSLVQQGNDASIKEARALCEKALLLNPRLPNAYSCLGALETQQGKYLKAQEHYLKGISVEEKTGDYAGLGSLYTLMGKYQEAEDALNKGLSFEQNNANIYFELGNLYSEKNEKQNAIEYYRQAVAIAEDNENYYRGLAIALMDKGEFSDAESLLRNAIRKLDVHRRWRLHLTLSRLLTMLGDEQDENQYYEEALKEVGEAVRQKSTSADVYFHMGIIQAKMQSYRAALRSFRKCIKLDPHHFEANRNAHRVQHLLRKENILSRGSLWGGIGVGVLAFTQLIVLWYLFLTGDKVDDKMVMLLVPILIGLVVIAFLLPWLIKIKLPGLEAELTKPEERVAVGPRGDFGFTGYKAPMSSTSVKK